MTTHNSKPILRNTTRQLLAQKGESPVVCLTAYDYLTAQALDAHCDLLLIGDSIGMVLYGMESTLGVTPELMVPHAQAVMRGSKQAAVVIDMPFGSYQMSKEQAYRTASMLISETNATAVKLEGGESMAETIRFLVKRGIPVMGHVGLMPQHVNTLGGYRFQGRTDEEADSILRDAQAVSDAGAFAIVLEGTETTLAEKITKHVAALTIGIGASPACDGQILVTEDMLGITERAPSFVKTYANIGDAIRKAAESYAAEVRARSFPAPEHCFHKKD